MNFRNKFLFLSIVSCLLFSCSGSKKEESVKAEESKDIASGASPVVEADENSYIVRVGQPAPDFEMELVDGSQMKLSDLRGKVVMLQFTASWCGVCRKEMPYIERDIWAKHKSNPDFALFGLDRDEPVETVKDFMVKTGVTYPVGLDVNGDIFGLFALKNAGITRNVIIDRDGKIVMLTRLFKEDEFNEMCNLIDSMLQI